MPLPPRSELLELLDGDQIPPEDLHLNMRELNTINTLLGGHAITCQGFLEVTQAARAKGKNTFTILEIGCGGGDNLLALHQLGLKLGLQLTFIGIDLLDSCLEVARSREAIQARATWINADYRKAQLPTQPDVVFSSLFCHHFPSSQIPEQLNWMAENCTLGFFINDLERNRFAKTAIGWLTALFSRSYLVKHDAPLSVMRGFTKQEWKTLIQESGLNTAEVKWKWAFRHLIVYQHPIKHAAE